MSLASNDPQRRGGEDGKGKCKKHYYDPGYTGSIFWKEPSQDWDKIRRAKVRYCFNCPDWDCLLGGCRYEQPPLKPYD